MIGAFFRGAFRLVADVPIWVIVAHFAGVIALTVFEVTVRLKRHFLKQSLAETFPQAETFAPPTHFNIEGVNIN